MSSIEAAQGPDFIRGGALAVLLLDPLKWMHRRVETVSFIDERSLQRRVSVDLTLPDQELLGLLGADEALIPLAFLNKELLIGFDARDENGASLPTLTKEQNGFLAWSVLARLASYEMEVETLSAALLTTLRTISSGDTEEALAALGSITERAEEGREPESRLVNGLLFMPLATDFASRFVLLCPVAGVSGSRRVIKFSYVTGFDEPSDAMSKLQRAGSRMGWIPAEFLFDAPAVGEAASYHFEFVSPAELLISEAEAVVMDGNVGDVVEGVRAGQRAHLYLGARQPSADCSVSVWLRPPRAGLVRASLVTTTATFVLLLFFLLGDRLMTLKVPEPVAILLSVPALVSTLVVRPGEHRLATDLLTGIRATVSLAGITAFVGAVLLVGGVAESTLQFSWKILVIVSGVCWCSCVVSYIGLPAFGRIGATEFLVSDLEENRADGEAS